MAKTKAPKTKKSTTSKLRWIKGKLPSGPFAGPVWGAKSAGMFLMIVPRAKKDKRGTCGIITYFELWTAGVVHDETPCATLAEAKAFAERSLPEILATARKAA
jgi:hypothetical protein